VQAGVDKAWEQEILETKKMLENDVESHTSSTRFVSPLIRSGNIHSDAIKLVIL
jgi:hypothetical protein